MYYMIASDLDGTLLSPKFYLTEYTKKIIRLLVQKGIHFIIATGRHYNEALKIRKNLGVPAFLITSNGARIHNPKNELVYSCDLDRNIVEKLLRKYLFDEDILTQLYSHNNWYIGSFNYKISLPYFLSSLKNKIFKFKYLYKERISKIFFISQNINKLLTLKEYIINYWGNCVNVSFSFPNCLEVMSKIVSKGNALKLVANILGLSLKDCISFGDGMNDKEMLDISGKGCIMKNGHCVLKKCLPNLEIIGSNKYDSVAEYLNNLYSK